MPEIKGVSRKHRLTAQSQPKSMARCTSLGGRGRPRGQSGVGPAGADSGPAEKERLHPTGAIGRDMGERSEVDRPAVHERRPRLVARSRLSRRCTGSDVETGADRFLPLPELPSTEGHKEDSLSADRQCPVEL